MHVHIHPSPLPRNSNERTGRGGGGRIMMTSDGARRSAPRRRRPLRLTLLPLRRPRHAHTRTSSACVTLPSWFESIFAMSCVTPCAPETRWPSPITASPCASSSASRWPLLSASSSRKSTRSVFFRSTSSLHSASRTAPRRPASARSKRARETRAESARAREIEEQHKKSG